MRKSSLVLKLMNISILEMNVLTGEREIERETYEHMRRLIHALMKKICSSSLTKWKMLFMSHLVIKQSFVGAGMMRR